MFKKIGHRGIVIIISIALALFFFFFPLTRQVGELRMYDLRLEWVRSAKLNPNIQMISIDQESLDKFGQFPWNRKTYAKLLENLSPKKPTLLIVDVLFQEPKDDEDAELAAAIKSSSFPVLLASSFDQPDAIGSTRLIDVVPALKAEAAGSGFINFLTDDPDGKFRKAVLAVENDGKIYPSLDLLAFAKLKGVKEDDIIYGVNKITVGNTVIKTDERYSIFIDYYFLKSEGGMVQTFPVRSYYKFIENPEKIPDLKNTVLILGAGSAGMQDDFPTPVEARTFGAVIHANALNTLLSGKHLERAPLWLNFLIVILIALIFGFLISKLYHVRNIILTSLVIIIGYSAINVYLFKEGIWLDWVPPLFTVFSCALVVTGMQFFRTHKLFQQFVVPEVANQMVANDEHSRLGGVEKEVSILFSDIRGYTSLSENMTPSQVMEMLNEYHAEMVKVFEKHYGRVVDYMGDAQMVVFGAPINRKDHAVCACRAAIATQDVLRKLCEKWHVESRTVFEVGIGICTGTVALGLVGAEGHKQYTAIGDSTNVASRLQGQSKILGAPIIISPLTAEKVKDTFELRALGKVELKGKSEPVEVFTVVEEKDSK